MVGLKSEDYEAQYRFTTRNLITRFQLQVVLRNAMRDRRANETDNRLKKDLRNTK
jgi:hypothetical protein